MEYDTVPHETTSFLSCFRVVARGGGGQVVNIHRAGVGAFEELVSKHLGEYITNEDEKVLK